MRADHTNQRPELLLPVCLHESAPSHHIARHGVGRVRKPLMSKFFAALSLLIAFALPTAAFALPCKYYDQSQQDRFPGDPTQERPGPFTLLLSPPSSLVKVNPLAPVGTVLAQQTIAGNSTIVDQNGVPARYGVIQCDSSIDGAWYDMLGQPTAYPHVYQTSVPGIGIEIVGWPLVWGPGVPQKSDMIATNQTLYIKYYKIGPIEQGGSIAGDIAAATIMYNKQPDFNIRFKDPLIIVPTIPTCSVSTPDVQVSLDSDAVASFTSVGMTRDEKDFKVSLACSGGDPSTSTNVHMFLSDQTTPSNQTNILTLDPSSTATGVGVQILNGSTPIVFGPTSTAPTTDITRNIVVNTPTVDIPLKARYVRTGNMAAGTVTAIATFTTTYN